MRGSRLVRTCFSSLCHFLSAYCHGRRSPRFLFFYKAARAYSAAAYIFCVRRNAGCFEPLRDSRERTADGAGRARQKMKPL